MTVDGVFFEFNIFQSFYREKSTTPSRDFAQKLKKCKITSRVFLELYVFQSSTLKDAQHHPKTLFRTCKMQNTIQGFLLRTLLIQRRLDRHFRV